MASKMIQGVSEDKRNRRKSLNAVISTTTTSTSSSSTTSTNNINSKTDSLSVMSKYLTGFSPLKTFTVTEKREQNKATNLSARSILNSSYEEYSRNESFDIFPKTDYTYAKSGSYSPRLLRKAYISPNMSRQRLRGTVTPPVSMLEDFSDSDSEHHVQSTSTALQIFSTPVTVISKTGYQHTSVYETDQLDFSDDVDNSVSKTPSRVKQKKHMDLNNLQKQQSGSNKKDMEGMVLRSGSHLKTSERSRNALSVKGSDSADGIYQSSKSASPSHGLTAVVTKTVTRTVTEIEELEDELNRNNSANARRRSTTRTPSPSTNRSYRNDSGRKKDQEYSRYTDERKRRSDEHQQEKIHHVKHMYGLDRTDEFSDSDSGTYSSSSGSVVDASYNRSSRRKKGRAEASWLVTGTRKISTSICILFETLTSAFWRVVTPSVRLYNKSFKTVWNTVTKVSRYFIIMDAWILGRAPHKGLCMCLPLLILLPLMLFAGGHFLQRAQGFRDSYLGMPFLFSSQENQMKSGTSNTLNFHHEVRQVLNQILMEKREWLTRVEAEQLVKRLLGPEIENLRVGLLNVANEGKTEQSSIRIDQNDAKVKLMTLEGQMAKLDTNVKNFEEALAESRKQFASSLSGNREQQANEMSVLEQAIVSIRAQLESLQGSFAAIIAQKKKCCLDDSTLASAVRDHVNVIVAELFQDGGKGSSGAAFAGWLNQNYVDRTEFERQLQILTVDITSKISSNIDAQRNSHSSFFLPTAAGTLGEDAVRLIVEDALLKYSADRTGLPDYALESAGGSVISTRCSETYYKKTALISIFGIPLWYTSNSPRTIIQPDVHPGQCWAFKGDSGYIVIQLSVPIRPTGFSLEHIPKSLSPNGTIDSAPKDFTVYGLHSESDTEGMNLGNFSYFTVGKPIQSFDVQVRNPGVFGYVELRVLSNHGNKDYTCLYRFRVHGVPQT